MNSILKFLIKVFKLQNLKPFLESILNMGKKSEVTFPKELIPLNLEVLIKGLLTSRVFEVNSNWVFPFWVEEQLNPKSDVFIPRGANIFAINTTYRNWTILGSIESDEKGVIDLKGMISPKENFPSLDIFIQYNNEYFFPSRNKIEQTVDDLTGIIKTFYNGSDFEYNFETFSSEKDKGIFLKYNFKSKKSGLYRFLFLIRPFNPESFIPIFDIEIKDNKVFTNSSSFLIPLTKDYKFILFDDETDINDFKVNEKNRITSKYGLSTGGIYYELNLNENEEKNFELFLPQEENYSIDLNFDKSKDDKIFFMKKERENELIIDVPDDNINRIFNSNKIYLKSLINSEYITPGPLTYKKFWFRDSAYMIPALMKIGDLKRAEKIIEYFKKKIKRDGYFQSQVGEWDSNGQAIFTMAEYYRYTKDKEFLNEFYPYIKKGAEWIERKRKKYVDSYGLLPSSFSAEHFGPNDLYYYDDYFGLKGLLDASSLANEIGNKNDSENFLKYYLEFKNDVRKAIDKDQKRLNKKICVGAFGRNIDASIIATFTSIFPLNLDLLSKDEIMNSYEELRKRFFVNNCFYQNITHSGINLYLTLEIAEALLYLNEEKEATNLFDSVISLLTKTYTGPEAINPKSLGGCEGDGHHGWLVAELIHFIRNSLLFEKENGVVILSGSRKEWFKDGDKILFNNGVTYFGNISFEVNVKENIIDIEFLDEINENIKDIYIYLPFEIEEILSGNFKRKEENYLIFDRSKKIILKRRLPL
ncbi:MAG TPA: hypothetical protein P5272_01275 [Caldisericia bacterium]|nr:hypothetical protein [Caldisericia bacterium]HOL82598.1 hypothetical protein [Caldisericia bacterium]HPP43270.1 hypothetical protein [Caldisericia bacterium]HRU73597.1 hypothetical protein [Caldisericia bacterium]